MSDPKAYFYDSIADDFEAIANAYDTTRRVEIVFDEMLEGVDLTGRTCLDVGCGLGWFSARARDRGARVTSLDIGVRLLAHTRRRAGSRPVAADACALPFADASFDMVISSECIEHTVAPARAVQEMIRVLRPGGTLVVTTPNHVWHFAVTLANALGIRPYDGYENWMRWGEMTGTLRASGARVEQMRGFHLLPPPLLPRAEGVLRWLDGVAGRSLGRVMVNMSVRATK